MKIPRSTATPECNRTRQSTTRVNAEFLAAAKALMAPAVSSLVPLQDTKELIDFFVAVFPRATPQAAMAQTIGMQKISADRRWRDV